MARNLRIPSSAFGLNQSAYVVFPILNETNAGVIVNGPMIEGSRKVPYIEDLWMKP